MSLEAAADLISDAHHILVFTGAGVSTESGIPDFRGPDGLWTKVDPDDFSIDRHLASAETRTRTWVMWANSPLRNARPNATHRAIARLAELGRLEGCVTQNVDGLHQAGGLDDALTVEVHGNVNAVSCLGCGTRWTAEEIYDRVAAGEPDPHCLECGGVIKLTDISFGQAMPIDELERGYAMAQNADAVLAVGTTLSVWPAADIPLRAARRGVPFIIINLGETDADTVADLKLDMAAGEAMVALVERLE